MSGASWRRRLRRVSAAAPGARSSAAGDLVVHAHGGGLVDRDDHRLAGLAAADEVGDEVFGDRLQAVVAGDEVILAGELALQLALLVVVEVGGLDQPPRCRR